VTKLLVLSAILVVSGASVWAQMGPRQGHGGRGGGYGPGQGRGPGIYSPPAPRTYGSPHGYGNVVFPGTGHAPGTYSPFSIVDPTFGARLSNTVSGFGYGYGYGHGKGYYDGYRQPRGYGYGYGYGGGVVVPYAVPVYVPYPEPQPQVHVVAPPQVIYIVQGEPDRSLTTTAPARQESIVTYVVPSRQNEPGPAGPEKKFYLIAFKNYSIYTATDYWLTGDTVHYITPYGAHNQASLDQLDLEFTERLNRERGMTFRLDKNQ